MELWDEGRHGGHAGAAYSLGVLYQQQGNYQKADTKVAKLAERVYVVLDEPAVCTDAHGIPFCVPGLRDSRKDQSLVTLDAH